MKGEYEGMQKGEKILFCRFIPLVLGIMLLAFAFNLLMPAEAFAKSDTLEITGDGVTNPVTFTREQLE
jgi:hypothetical protein